MIMARVIKAVTGARSKFVFAAGARFRPIRATIAPVTIGGISRLIQPAPNFCTTAPIEGQRDAGQHHAAQRPGDAELLLGRHDRRDEGEAGAEVAGHPALA